MNRKQFFEKLGIVGFLAGTPFLLKKEIPKDKMLWGTDRYRNYKLERPVLPKDAFLKKVWTAEDIKAGLYITKNLIANKDVGALMSVTYQIGYNISFGVDTSGKERAQYVLSSVADGWNHGDTKYLHVRDYRGYTKTSLAEFLNDNKYGYRPTTKEEMHAIIDYSNKNFL